MVPKRLVISSLDSQGETYLFTMTVMSFLPNPQVKIARFLGGRSSRDLRFRGEYSNRLAVASVIALSAHLAESDILCQWRCRVDELTIACILKSRQCVCVERILVYAISLQMILKILICLRKLFGIEINGCDLMYNVNRETSFIYFFQRLVYIFVSVSRARLNYGWIMPNEVTEEYWLINSKKICQIIGLLNRRETGSKFLHREQKPYMSETRKGISVRLFIFTYFIR